MDNKSQIRRLVLKYFVFKKPSSIFFSDSHVLLVDPTYMIRAIPANASDNVYCTLLAHSAIHGAMAGYTGFTIGPVNSRHAYIPFQVTCLHPLPSGSRICIIVWTSCYVFTCFLLVHPVAGKAIVVVSIVECPKQ